MIVLPFFADITQRRNWSRTTDLCGSSYQ